MTFGGARAAVAGMRPLACVACGGLVALGKSDELGNDVELGKSDELGNDVELGKSVGAGEEV